MVWCTGELCFILEDLKAHPVTAPVANSSVLVTGGMEL